MNFEQNELVFISDVWLDDFKRPVNKPTYEENGLKYFEFLCHGVDFVVIQKENEVVFRVYQIIDKDVVTWVSVRQELVLEEARKVLIQKSI